jgi:hypothetical protein
VQKLNKAHLRSPRQASAASPLPARKEKKRKEKRREEKKRKEKTTPKPTPASI